MKAYQEDTIVTYEKNAEIYRVKRASLVLKDELERFKNLLHGKKVLEVGCGPGRDALVLSAYGLDVTGIDLSSELIRLAKKEAPNATFFVADVLEMDFPKCSFDGVWSCASLLHLKKEDLPKALTKIFNVLNPEGIFFLSMKKGEGEETVVEKEFSGMPRFFSYYSENELKKHLESAGFNIIDMYISNEKKRFSEKDRNTDFIAIFASKRNQ